jgi:hypothetical protein
MRSTMMLAALAIVTALAGCGGGGGSGNTTQTAATSPSTSTPPSTPAPSITLASNQVPVTVDYGLYGTPNVPTTSVTICVPGTAMCQTINNVMIDTGSYGLRLFASQVSLSLPTRSAAAGGTLTNCAYFGSGIAYGSVRIADIRLNGEVASSTPIELIHDPDFATAPGTCAAASLGPITQPSQLGVNGILGIGVEPIDCPACETTTTASGNAYFGCTSSSSCTPSTAPASDQVTNPVVNFPADNNGSAITLPAIATTGAASVTGTLTFGIGTESNNTLDAATIYTAVPQEALFSTTFNGTAYDALLDSGSNGLFFPDASLNGCTYDVGFYCPGSTLSLSAQMSGSVGSSVGTSTQSFTIANAQSQFATGNVAFDNIGGSITGLFDWGLPFFYGRTIYFAIDGQSTSGGSGPYFAF